MTEQTGVRRRGIAVRIALVTTSVALLSVLVAAGLSYGLIRGAADTQARRQLARQLTLVTGLTAGPTVPPKVGKLLSRSGTRLVLIDRDGTVTGAGVLPDRDLRALRAGRRVSRVETINGQRSYVEGRARAAGGAVALVQVAKLAPRDQSLFLGRELLALLIGLLVAVLAGLLLAGRIARPMQRVAAAARRLAGGDRAVRLDTGGPAEVAGVAVAVNELAGALQTSEERQRQFLLSVSHELRTPLTSIAGFAEALADGVTDPGDVPAVGRLMAAQSARLQRLIEDLLTLARLEADDFVITMIDLDLAAFLHDTARPWQARAAGHAVSVEPPGERIVLRSDPVRLRQVLDALLDNATRVTPTGAPVVLAGRLDADSVIIEVRDGGPGLREEDLTEAFVRGALHARAAPEQRGSAGLGLALVERMTTRLGGRVGVSRADEGGACFTITLPRSGAP